MRVHVAHPHGEVKFWLEPAVERPAPEHLYWPLLDVDLSVASIRHPDQFPLRSGLGAPLRMTS